MFLLSLPQCDPCGDLAREASVGQSAGKGQGHWMWDGDFPPKRAGQNPVFGVCVKLRFGFHWFLQQILQGKNHFYLLLPAAACAGMSPPPGTQQSWHNKVLPLALSMERVTFSDFSSVFQLPVAKFVSCDAYASSASPWLPVSQPFPRDRAA